MFYSQGEVEIMCIPRRRVYSSTLFSLSGTKGTHFLGMECSHLHLEDNLIVSHHRCTVLLLLHHRHDDESREDREPPNSARGDGDGGIP